MAHTYLIDLHLTPRAKHPMLKPSIIPPDDALCQLPVLISASHSLFFNEASSATISLLFFPSPLHPPPPIFLTLQKLRQPPPRHLLVPSSRQAATCPAPSSCKDSTCPLPLCNRAVFNIPKIQRENPLTVAVQLPPLPPIRNSLGCSEPLPQNEHISIPFQSNKNPTSLSLSSKPKKPTN